MKIAEKIKILTNDILESVERGTEFDAAVQLALWEVKQAEKKEIVLDEIFANDPYNILNVETEKVPCSICGRDETSIFTCNACHAEICGDCCDIDIICDNCRAEEENLNNEVPK
ncbi:MAG TPA: hypothetical protein VMV36_01575 [Ignavibacteriaceae bacterium]|nr:hypothetical protein [Ignavibacteriaceae bacterium]